MSGGREYYRAQFDKETCISHVYLREVRFPGSRKSNSSPSLCFSGNSMEMAKFSGSSYGV